MRTLLIVSLVLLASFAFGQNTVDNISPVQGGTAIMQDGKAVIVLNETAMQLLANKTNSPKYIVSITPLCNCGQFYVSEKGANSFTVEQTGDASGVVSFDYVVYVEGTITMKPVHSIKTAPSK